MRAVLDTNVAVAAVRSRRGASNAVLVEAFRGRFDWLMSVPLFLEHERALTRTENEQPPARLDRRDHLMARRGVRP